MVKRYLDWNGNGGIDPVDIAVTHVLDDEVVEHVERADGSSSDSQARASGCLPSALIALAAIVAPPLYVIAVL